MPDIDYRTKKYHFRIGQSKITEIEYRRFHISTIGKITVIESKIEEHF